MRGTYTVCMTRRTSDYRAVTCDTGIGRWMLCYYVNPLILLPSPPPPPITKQQKTEWFSRATLRRHFGPAMLITPLCKVKLTDTEAPPRRPAQNHFPCRCNREIPCPECIAHELRMRPKQRRLPPYKTCVEAWSFEGSAWMARNLVGII